MSLPLSRTPRRPSPLLPTLGACMLAACAEAPPPPPQTTLGPPPQTLAPPPRTPWETPRALEVRLAPERDTGAHAIALDVALRLSVPPVEFGGGGELVLALGEAETRENSVAARIEELFARDNEGALGFSRVPAVAGAPEQPSPRVTFRAERRTRGPVTLTYRVRIPQADPRAPAALGAQGGAFMGRGEAFLLLPLSTEPFSIKVHWDTEALGEQAMGLSSLGDGDLGLDAPLSALQKAVWAGGTLHQLAVQEPSPGLHFRAVTAGQPHFDPTDMGIFAERIWIAGRRLLSPGRASYQLFVRVTPGQALEADTRGTYAFARVGDERALDWATRRALARAMVRATLPATLSRSSPWFAEGFTTYFTHALLLGARLASTEEVAADLAASTERHFKSALRDKSGAGLSGSEVEAQLAEDRGMLYAAELDAAIRSKTDGKRTLADLMRMLSTPLEDGRPIATDAAFRELLAKEVGEGAADRFTSVIQTGGASPDVPEGAFAPCIVRLKRRFTVGKGRVEGYSFGRAPKAPAEACGTGSR